MAHEASLPRNCAVEFNACVVQKSDPHPSDPSKKLRSEVETVCVEFVLEWGAARSVLYDPLE